MSARKHQDQREPKAPAFQNNKLKEQLARWKTEAKSAEQAPAPRPRAVHLPPKPRREAPINENADEALFRAAMGDVAPIPRAHSDHTPAFIQRTAQEIDEDAEALAQLAELVTTGEGLDLTKTDEHIEGIARNVDHGLLRKLRAGDFSLQAHLDLHGLLSADAHIELERFLIESRKRGHRCVLVIHGRGLHSKDQEPVLKSRMGVWLSRGKLARIVLAFATARPTDGGAGALYVLLRR
jgi:DNA-nicking Smr family endonuclease